MDISAVKARVFPPANRCIYCGSDGGGTLTTRRPRRGPHSAARELHDWSGGDFKTFEDYLHAEDAFAAP